MKITVLLLFFLLPFSDNDDTRPMVYPNPAADYISLSNDGLVVQLVLYNFSGRQVCAFNASKGQKYNISELPTGMYLVQFLDGKKKIMHTQRLQKR